MGCVILQGAAHAHSGPEPVSLGWKQAQPWSWALCACGHHKGRVRWEGQSQEAETTGRRPGCRAGRGPCWCWERAPPTVPLVVTSMAGGRWRETLQPGGQSVSTPRSMQAHLQALYAKLVCVAS